MVELFHAFQYVRDEDIQLGMMMDSWAMNLITSMWFENSGEAWLQILEQMMCVKVFQRDEELEGLDLVHMNTSELFWIAPRHSLADYAASQMDIFRRFYSMINRGNGVTSRGFPTEDACMGINSLFPTPEERALGIYTVIHSRSMEGAPGLRIMRKVAAWSGCDPTAALEMRPEYIKSILGPLGMLRYPVVLITDGQDGAVTERLRADPDIGPMLRVPGAESSSISGDITLAVMSNVFIGNPASSFSTFIGKARLALGFGHNELWRVQESKTGVWRTTCGDHCLYDRVIVGDQA